MFDLIAGNTERPLRQPAPGSKVAALITHVVILGLVISIPVFRATAIFVDSPAMAAFVAPPPAPPPPPPPPPAPARAAAAPRVAQPALKKPESATPIEMPPRPEAVATAGTLSSEGEVGGVAGGVAGGVQGGVVGGMVGGAVGGMILQATPLPPPARVRVGGQIKTPTLLHRVDPDYPSGAVAARLTGVVILEAEVGTDGTIQTVTVLRSRHRLLDTAAVDALKQWRYTPLVLNDIATPFVLTVTFTFSRT